MENKGQDAGRVRTRRRRALACVPCRQKKLGCDRRQPCTGCIRSKDRHVVCSYAPDPGQGSRLRTQASTVSEPRNTVPDTVDPASATVTIANPQPSAGHVIPTVKAQRENQTWYSSNVADILVATPPSTGSAMLPNLNKPPDLDRARVDDHIATEPVTIPRLLEGLSEPINAVMVKTRYFARSGWLYSVLLVQLLDPLPITHVSPFRCVGQLTTDVAMQIPQSLAWLERLNKDRGECFHILKACKFLSKRLRDQQTLPWTYGDYGRTLPGRVVADLLLDNYLRTFETVHRVLHVPSFRRKYDLLWEDSGATSVDFVLQVQLCLALGSLLYDDAFSLRAQSLQWIQEAGAWIDSSAKPRLVFSTIQTMCLHRIARESTQRTYGDLVWIISGSLIRAAMSIGLHRDPTRLPATSSAQAEMRRRLWTTVVELTLGSCLDPGAAPLVSLEDFDCALPSNFDDAQLDLESEDNLAPRPSGQYTDSSVQIALGQSLAIRLAIVKSSAKLKTDSYQETLRLSSEYARACQSLSSTLQSLQPRLSGFQRQYCEMIMTRYIFTLHIPYMVIGPQNPSYMLSEKACTDAALAIAHSCLPLASTQDQLLAAVRAMDMAQPQDADFVRLCALGSSPFRPVLFQALMVIAAQLVALADGSRSSFRWPVGAAKGSNPLRGNLRALELMGLLRAGAEWTSRRVRVCQEANKDHLFVALAMGSVEALLNGESLAEALDASGRTACSEAKLVLEELNEGNGDSEGFQARFSPEDEDLLGFNDRWWIQPDNNFEIDLI